MLDNYHAKIDVQITLMHLVQNNMRTSVERIGVVDKPHKEYACGHEYDLSFIRGHRFHTHLVADLLPHWFIQLLSYPSGDVDCCQTTRLRTNNLDRLVVNLAILKDVFWDLSGLSTPSIARDNDNSILTEFVKNFRFVLQNWKIFGDIKRLLFLLFKLLLFQFFLHFKLLSLH